MAKIETKLPNSPEEANKLGMLEPEEARATLERDMEDVQSRNRTVNSNQLIQQNKLEEMKVKLIQSLFGMMKELGVDPSDLESINQFRQSLRQQDPDLAEMFEVAFNNLLQGSAEPTAPPVDIAPSTQPQPGPSPINVTPPARSGTPPIQPGISENAGL